MTNFHSVSTTFKLRLLLASIGLLVSTASMASAGIITAPSNLSLVSTNALNTSSNASIDVSTAFDGLLNQDGTNGAVFNLTGQNPSEWIVDFVNVADINALELFQQVGNLTDNGIQDFSIEVFDGSGATGQTLLEQSFSAALSPNNTSEIFALDSTVVNPGSFLLSVTSSFGNASLAEFSEIQFDGTIASADVVPEPTSLVIAIGMLGCVLIPRRRSASV